MGDSDMNTLDRTAAVEVTGKIMVIAIIVLFLVVVVVLFLHLYAKWFWWRVEGPRPSGSSHRRGRRRRFVFSPGQESAMPARRGLDPVVLISLPVAIYKPEDFKEELECAVCLCEVAEGEKVRLLPKCNHGFHLECIDMWFHSHSTCPLCRNSVSAESVDSDADMSSLSSSIHDVEENSNFGDGNSMESPNFPTNVLFWGDESQVSSGNGCLGSEEVASGESPSSSSPSNARPDGALMIDIPRSVNDNAASTSGCTQEELKSPVVARLKSLKRLLSREARVNPCSPTSSDIEQGRREIC